jgi:6-phosphogluconolactonase (cycloisomerase 2 family)
MRQALYVSLHGDDKILQYTLDPATGDLRLNESYAVPGGPAPLTVDPSRRYLYAARRGDKQVSSFRIDEKTSALSLIGTLSLPSDPPFLATDRTGRFLLSAYYQVGHIAVHPINDEGAAVGPAIEWIETATGAHSIQTDPSNRFVFVPHIADRGSNEIRQFLFDEQTGRLTPNAEPIAIPPGPLGPRHFCFNPNLDLLYFCNEQGCSVTAYAFDKRAGTLSAVQTVSTLPEAYKDKSTSAEIRMAPSGRFLYASNRGHNSMACFSIDGASGQLAHAGHTATEAVPRAFTLDPDGRYLYAAGLESGRLASYAVDQASGRLRPLRTYEVGSRPMWVLATSVGD